MNRRYKVLIVEDETIIALELRRIIENLGYEVTATVTSYEDAIKSVKKNAPDIALLDINLQKDKDGIETAIDIQKLEDIQIIFLTSATDEETMESAMLQANAENYLNKPFNRTHIKPALFKAQLKVKRPDKYNLGGNYEFELKTQKLFLNNQPIKLSKKEANFFALLVEAKGELVSFTTIQNIVWPNEAVGDGAIRNLIYRLRNKLDKEFIETTPGYGCKLLV